MQDPKHFNRTPRRNAEFITPPNTLKNKVGTGGLSEDILNKAQALLENHSLDFSPMAEMFLTSLLHAIEKAQNSVEEDLPDSKMPKEEAEKIISALLYPGMQLKANGSMFKYNLVTDAANILIQFLEVIEKPDIESIEIVFAFHTAIKAVINGKITGDGGAYGNDLLQALNAACFRYFDKFSHNIDQKKIEEAQL